MIHVLNGDALRNRIPKEFKGDLIVFRESLMSGPVPGKTSDEVLDCRKQFFASKGWASADEYEAKSLQEIAKLKQIPSDHEVNLWFEEDLFCQVNFWFSAYMLENSGHNQNNYWVRPTAKSPYAFSNFSDQELNQLFTSREQIPLEPFAQLWNAYQQQDEQGMLKIAKHWQKEFPHLLPVVQAQIDRRMNSDQPGRPEQQLLQIQQDVETTDFDNVFAEFTRREAIYGMGDLQVRELWEQINTN